MAGDILGRVFRVVNFGESHGPGVGAVVEGVPPRTPVRLEDIQRELDRRRPGQSRITTARAEGDRVEILSGVLDGRATGTPIALLIRNEDQRSGDYANLKELYRPSHADFAWEAKYGIRDAAGGGRSSARVTAGTVAAGAIAKRVLRELAGVEILAWVKSVHGIEAKVDPDKVTLAQVEKNILRCPDAAAATRLIALIERVKRQGDSVGGVIECVCRGVPAGWGEPVYDKLEADLAGAMLSINATKGFEIGSGFASTRLLGSQHNDLFAMKGARIVTRTNRSGGVQGGISNGMPVVFRVAFKPTATILKPQKTVGRDGKALAYQVKGRHDPCVLPRAVPIVEAMAAIVLADHALRQRAQTGRTRA